MRSNPSHPDAELDPATLAELHDLSEATGDDVLRKLVDAFVLELPARVAALKAALDANDFTALARAAHAMRSAAGLGAVRYANLCAAVESRVRDDNRAEAIALANQLITESDRIVDILLRAAGANP